MSNNKSTTSDFSNSAVTRQRANVKIVQNVILIWLDSSIDDSNADCQNTIGQLRRVVNSIDTFTDVDQCIAFVETVNNERTCMIISGSLGQYIVPRVHNMFQVDSIFIFCGNKKRHEVWAKDWSKIKGVFTEISPICEALKQAAQLCEQNAISISFVGTSENTSNQNLDQLDSSFMYTQILKEILLTITFEEKHFKELIDYCRDVFAGNASELKNIDILREKYRYRTPIYWYTYESFLYPMLNRALRLMDVDIIIKMGFFISDLYRHIERLHSEQFNGQHSSEPFTVYRGQGVSNSDLEQMIKTKGGLLSFNNFLSTSKSREVSLAFAESNLLNPSLVGVLFVMTIDPSKSTTPFVSTDDHSYVQSEEEVLFAMHTIFRICDIEQMSEDNRLFKVNLTLTSDNDKDLRALTDRIREETFPYSKGWYRLGLLLLKMAQFDKAQQLFEGMLDQTTDESEKGNIYAQLGRTKHDQGEYEEALTFYEKSLQIYQKLLSLNHPNLAQSYNNIGAVYENMGEYAKALSYNEKALEIRQQSLPPNHPDLATSYNNIGAVYYNMRDYSKALSYYEKSLEIQKQSLPPNHPSLAQSYNNIGVVYENIGEYAKALSYNEKALEIRQQSLPPNHPDLATSYNNIGGIYEHMGEYPQALSSLEKSLAIQQRSLPPNHPNLANSYSNIGMLYNKMGKYSEALSFHEKALEIRQKTLPSDHPDLAISYNNIGLVYDNMGEYQTALFSHEKALKIRQKALSPNHPDLATSYNNIGLVYDKMEQWPKALLFHEKALEIYKLTLPSSHPNLAISYNNIGEVHFEMGDYSKALSFYQCALDIGQQSLLANHPHVQTVKRTSSNYFSDQ
jgi:tetratricopeptide (TPR) repeat protein